MRKLFYVLNFILGILSVQGITAETLPITGSIEGSMAKPDFFYESTCQTPVSTVETIASKVLYVPGKTMITFYGDSRLDFADVYGKDMMYYLNEASNVNDTEKRNPGWYLQNFGHAGWLTTDIKKHFRECLSSPTYFTGKSFVVNIGGNNWFYASIFIKANPWVGFLVNVYTRNDINDILIRLGDLASVDKSSKKRLLIWM